MVPISFAYLARFTKGLGCDFKLSWHEQICKLCKVGMIWGDHQSPSCYYIVHTAHRLVTMTTIELYLGMWYLLRKKESQ